MGADLIVRYAPALVAIEERHEEHWFDAYIREFLEYLLRRKWMIVASHACMVPTDNEMRAAVVLPHDSMEYGFPGACIAHLRLENAKNDPVLWIIIVDQDFVTVKYYIILEIAFLLLANNRIIKSPSTIVRADFWRYS